MPYRVKATQKTRKSKIVTQGAELYKPITYHIGEQSMATIAQWQQSIKDIDSQDLEICRYGLEHLRTTWPLFSVEYKELSKLESVIIREQIERTK